MPMYNSIESDWTHVDAIEAIKSWVHLIISFKTMYNELLDFCLQKNWTRISTHIGLLALHE